MNFLALILLLIFYGCSQSGNDTKERIEHFQKEFLGCKDSVVLNKFFQDLIDNELISNNLYTTSVDSLGYLSMRKIDEYPFELQLVQFQAPVRILDKSEIDPKKAILSIKNIKKIKDTLYVTMTYDVINVTWKFKYVEERPCSWKKIAEEMEIE